MKTITSLLLIFISVSVSSYGQSLLVPQEYSTVQSAIDASENGDTVLVDTGIYYENINLKGKNILLTSYFRIRKTYKTVFNTIIDGGKPVSDTGRAVLIISGENDSCVIEGFTIQHGNSITKINNTGEGGGFLIENSSPIVRFNVIRYNNSDGGGGGVSLSVSKAVFTNNIFYGNTGGHSAAFICNDGDSVVFRNNLVTQNIAGHKNVGVVGFYSSTNSVSFVENNTIVGNGSPLSGAGLTMWSFDYTAARNNIIYGNASAVGRQISMQWNAKSDFYYNLLPEEESGSDNIIAPPEFEGNTFYLSEGSPAIDAGDPSSEYEDIDSVNTGDALFPSKGSTRGDMGCYGGPLAAPFSVELQPILYVYDMVDVYDTMGSDFTTSLKIFNLGLQALGIDSVVSLSPDMHIDRQDDTVLPLSNITITLSGIMPYLGRSTVKMNTYYNGLETPIETGVVLNARKLPTTITHHKTHPDYTLYPNPAHDIINLAFSNPQTGIIAILDLTGKILLEKRLANETKKVISIAGLDSGVYFIHVSTQSVESVERIQVVR